MSTRTQASRVGVGRLAVTGLLAAAGAAVATTVVAALARAAGAQLEVPADSGEPIPLAGVAFVTAVCSLVGLALAVALRRWSGRPAQRFVQVTVALTALSLVPPLVSGGTAGTVVTLVALHLVAAAIVIPALARRLQAA